jgi:hypothetical protein
VTLFWPKNSREDQNGLDKKGKVLEKNVLRDLFLELVVKSMKISTLKLPTYRDIGLSHGMTRLATAVVQRSSPDTIIELIFFKNFSSS